MQILLIREKILLNEFSLPSYSHKGNAIDVKRSTVRSIHIWNHRGKMRNALCVSKMRPMQL